jgi:hypothetical protein
MSVGNRNPSKGSDMTPHFLLAFLLLSFALQPIAHVANGLLVRLALAAILVASIHVVSSRRGFFIIGLLLGVPALGFLFIPSEFVSSGISTVVGGALGIATLLFICYVILDEILSNPAVTSGTISAALVVYLMLGLVWAQAYRLLEYLRPGSFAGLSAGSVVEVERDLFYFSYVTLTTLGYGDISPVGADSRALVITEAIVGQLYLVVMVAGIVGMHLVQRLVTDDA